jgi:hypothetical protein
MKFEFMSFSVGFATASAVFVLLTVAHRHANQHRLEPTPGFKIQSNGLEYRVVQPDGTICTSFDNTSYEANVKLAHDIAVNLNHDRLPWHEVTNQP